MADAKITDGNDIGTLQDTDEIPLGRVGSSSKTTTTIGAIISKAAADIGVGGGGGGHTIQEAGTPRTARANLNFAAPFTATDDAGNNRTTVDLPVATTSAKGAMSAADKAKADSQTIFIGDKTGATDITTALLTVMNAKSTAGGGEVFLPAGIYKRSSNSRMIIPANVQLVGESNGDDTAGKGTNIYVYDAATSYANCSTSVNSKNLICADGGFTSGDVGKWVRVAGAGINGRDLYSAIASYTNANTVVMNKESDTAVTGAIAHSGFAAVELYNSSAIRNVNIHQPEQDGRSTPLVFPPAISTTYATTRQTVDNVAFRTVYIGISASESHSHLTVNNLRGGPLYIGFLNNESWDVDRVSNVHFNPGNSVAETDLQQWAQDNGTAYVIESVDWTRYDNIFSFGYLKGLSVRNGRRNSVDVVSGLSQATIVNSGFDACQTGVEVIEDAWGLKLLNSDITAYRYNYTTDAADPTYQGDAVSINAAGDDSDISIDNLEVWGPTGRAIYIAAGESIGITNLKVRDFGSNATSDTWAVQIDAGDKIAVIAPQINGMGRQYTNGIKVAGTASNVKLIAGTFQDLGLASAGVPVNAAAGVTKLISTQHQTINAAAPVYSLTDLAGSHIDFPTTTVLPNGLRAYNSSGSASLSSHGNLALLQLKELDAGVDQKFAEWFQDIGKMSFRFMNDAYDTASTILEVTRNSGTYTVALFDVFPLLQARNGIKFGDATTQTTAYATPTLDTGSTNQNQVIAYNTSNGITYRYSGMTVQGSTNTITATNLTASSAVSGVTVSASNTGTFGSVTANSTGLGVNTSSPMNKLEIRTTADSETAMTLRSVRTHAVSGGVLALTHNNAANAAPASGDRIGDVLFGALTTSGTEGASGASIRGLASQNWSDTATDRAMDVAFFVRAAGAGLTEKFRIQGAGNVRFSNQPAAPANNAAGTVGDMIVDAAGGFIYFCTGLGGTNNWKRIALSAF